MTPKLVTLKFSKGLDLLEVFKKGYKKRGMWAFQIRLIFQKYSYHLRTMLWYLDGGRDIVKAQEHYKLYMIQVERESGETKEGKLPLFLEVFFWIIIVVTTRNFLTKLQECQQSAINTKPIVGSFLSSYWALPKLLLSFQDTSNLLYVQRPCQILCRSHYIQ